jgi:hypothetical protein
MGIEPRQASEGGASLLHRKEEREKTARCLDFQTEVPFEVWNFINR